jgi:hypothetical protein
MRHAIVDENNMVVNVVVWHGAEWLPPRNHTVVRHENCDIGDKYDPTTNSFIKPRKRNSQAPWGSCWDDVGPEPIKE